jgi:hypothetical protein
MEQQQSNKRKLSGLKVSDEVVRRVDLTTEALSGLDFAHEQADLLLDALMRAIHRSNATMSAESSAHTTPQKEEQFNESRTRTGTGTGRKLFDWGQGSEYLRSPFGRRRDAADEREALVCLSNKLEDLQMALELPQVNLSKIDKARGELLDLALRKANVVVRERTVLEDVLFFSGLEEKRVEEEDAQEEELDALQEAIKMNKAEGSSHVGAASVGDLLIDYFDGRETATEAAAAAAKEKEEERQRSAEEEERRRQRRIAREEEMNQFQASPAKSVVDTLKDADQMSRNATRFGGRRTNNSAAARKGGKGTRHSPTSVLDQFRDSPNSSLDTAKTTVSEREVRDRESRKAVMLDEALPAPGLQYRDSGAIHPSKLSGQPVVAESEADSEAEAKEGEEEGDRHNMKKNRKGPKLVKTVLLLGGLAYCQAITSANPKIFEASSKFIQCQLIPHVGSFLQNFGAKVSRHVRPQRMINAVATQWKKKTSTTTTKKATKPKQPKREQVVTNLAELPTMSVSERSVVSAWAQSSFGKG